MSDARPSAAPECVTCRTVMDPVGWSHLRAEDAPKPERVYRCPVCGALFDVKNGYRPSPADI